MKTAAYWIDRLGLMPHPEGGHYRETYRAEGTVRAAGFDGERNHATAIYFMLTAADRSMFHRIKSDELWHFHAGGRLTIYVLTDNGLATHKLGPDPDKGDHLQVIIPAHHWFGAEVSDGAYVLAGCTVAPGFDFRDFEMARQQDLLEAFPHSRDIVLRLTAH